MPTAQRSIQNLDHKLTSITLDSMMEYQILKFWREHEPEKVEKLTSKGMLRQALTETADALWNLQIELEDKQGMDSTLASTEAWNRLMKLEAAEEEARTWPSSLQMSG